jgi:hypothetical protein
MWSSPGPGPWHYNRDPKFRGSCTFLRSKYCHNAAHPGWSVELFLLLAVLLAARGNPDLIAILSFFIEYSEMLGNLPLWLERKVKRRVYPWLCVRLRVHDRYRGRHCFGVYSLVALRNLLFFAVRITKEFDPGRIVKPDRVDNECVSLPLANRDPSMSDRDPWEVLDRRSK